MYNIYNVSGYNKQGIRGIFSRIYRTWHGREYIQDCKQ
jgi:hypothetical protein